MVILPPAQWRESGDLVLLGRILGQADVRVVGGAVRDTLAGQKVKDIDLATRLTPDLVMAKLNAAGIKTIPTGLAHGTVTAVMPMGPVEITTLRRDVATDGRHATVAFTDDWRVDAARRDFTINALYADVESGEIYDYFGGIADLSDGIVRFIGDPLERIAEDHLRILRFFRFTARYGEGAPDAQGFAACAARANDLMALSRERIAGELLSLLALPKAGTITTLMIAHGIWKPVLPEITSAAALVALPQGDAILCLASLLPPDPQIVTAVAKRLTLSKAITKRLAHAAGRTPSDCDDPQALAYRLGIEAAEDRLTLLGATNALEQIKGWSVPRLPITGGALVTRGLTAGPDVARALKQIEDQWVAEGFPTRARVDVIADHIVGEIQP